jgi:UDP:flavonoid glycosyltransferase YjiC (YdhE family)
MSHFFASVRERALALADTGDCADWPAVAEQLAKEGYGKRVIVTLGRDHALKTELRRAIQCARDRRERAEAENPAKASKRMSPALPLHHLGRRR